jgi:hypothetical protein
LADTRLSANVALLNRSPQTFSGQNIFSGNVGIGTVSSAADPLDIFTGNRRVAINPIDPLLGGSGGVIGLSRPGNGAMICFLGAAAWPTEDTVLLGSGGATELRLVSSGGGSKGFGFYLNTALADAFGDSRPTNTLAVKIDELGRVGIGTPTPSAVLDILAGQGAILLTSTNSGFGSSLSLINNSSSQGASGAVGFYSGSLANRTGNISASPDGSMHFEVGGNERMILSANGALQLHSTFPSYYGPSLSLINYDNNQISSGSIGFYSSSTNNRTANISAGTDGTIHLAAGDNDYTQISPDGTVTVRVLQISGADVAEPFRMSSQDIPKGSVVIIDEDNPGQLRVSEHAYDSHVAGILSGANGVNSGILLKQQGFNDGGQNVALSGRVYALADASFGPIKPGDLLTTSDTQPGARA